MIEFLRIAHLSSTIDSWCFIGSVVTFAFNKMPNCTTKKNVDRINIGSKNVGVIHERPFFHRLFLWKLMEFLRIAHVSSTIGSWCFSGSVVTFAFYKRPYSTTWLRCQNQNLFKKVGIINDWPFLYRHFCMKIVGFFKNCSRFIDYRLLMLYRIRRNFCAWQETILHNMTTLSESKSVKKCRNY